jgi:thymidine kinase
MVGELYRGRERVGDGWIEVICGAMFSGKTEELIKRLNRAIIAGMQVEIFKPLIDDRYDTDKVVSHDHTSIRSSPVALAEEILLLTSRIDVVGIDEGQFFDSKLADVANILADQGKRVIISGLDMDYQGRPFHPMDELMAVAEYVTKLHAICVQCGALASYSYRREPVQDRVLVGEKDKYEARCRQCFNRGTGTSKARQEGR